MHREEVAGIRELGEVGLHKIQQDNRSLVEMQRELKDDVVRMKEIGENNQSNMLKIHENVSHISTQVSDMTMRVSGFTTQVSDITTQVSDFTTQISEVKDAEKAITSQLTEIRAAEQTTTRQLTEIQSTLETRLAATVEHSLEKYTQFMTTKIDKLFPQTARSHCPPYYHFPRPAISAILS